MESWIETCSELFPGEGIRDFWELTWNVAVCAWDFMDRSGSEPWRRPNPGFPFLNPSFWRGGRRNRLLFADSKEFIGRFPVNHPTAFLDWIETVVRFQYGAGLESIPFGMVALALNAPSESYLLEVELAETTKGQNQDGYQGAWRISFTPGKGWNSQSCPVHQVFFDPPVVGLMAQTVVLTGEPQRGGHVFFRTLASGTSLPDEMTGSLEQALSHCLGQDWGTLNDSDLQRVAARPLSPGFPVESDWPWLGCTRSLLQWWRKEATG